MFHISLMMMMTIMLYTFENLFSIFWNRMIYEKWIEWSNSKDFCVKCQDFLQSKHNISKLLFINYPGKLPFSLETIIRYECSHLVSLPYQTSWFFIHWSPEWKGGYGNWFAFLTVQNIKGRKCIFKVINEVKVPTSEILKFLLSS